MSEFSEYTDSLNSIYTDDSPKSCSCGHCRTEGRLEQTPDCTFYRRPEPDDLPMINRAARIVPSTKQRGRRAAR